MSTTIDERVVEMKFDNRHFENNVQTSLSTIEKLKKGLKFDGATKGLENVGDAAKNVSMTGIGSAVDTVKVKFSALEVMAVTALSNITNSAINTGKRMLSALTIDPIKTGFQEYETQINAVQTILANTSSKGGTLQQVNAALEELNIYADKTIYNFTEMTRNIGTFTAAGVDLKTSVSAIKGIANLAAVSGSTSQQASTAMYQLSQALASGTVKLMDWNSVVNAGMGGQIFQDSLKETARLHGVAIDQMIKDEGSFRETLADGWLTSDILTETLSKFTGDLNARQLETMGYTKEQIAEIMKLGDMANKAATEVKTFSQLWDTLKEAAQSGWTQSWQLIVGDFGEAKSLLTTISDTLGKIIGESAEARNAVLSKGLSSGWKQFLKAGISDEAGYIEAIKATATEQGIAVDKMIEKEGSFEATLKSGWLTTDIMTKSLSDLTDKTKGLSDEQIEQLGYTRDQINSLESLNKSVKNGSVSVDEFANKMKLASGRENMIEALSNAFKGLASIIAPLNNAFKEIFPSYTGEQLYALTERIKNFTSGLVLTDSAADKLKRTFKGVFAIVDIGRQAFVAIFNAIVPLFNGLDELGDGVLDITASWGDWAVKLNETIKTTDVFNTSIQNVIRFLTNARDKVVEFGTKLGEKLDFPGLELLHNFLGRLYDRFSQVTDITEIFGGVTVGIIQFIGDALGKSNILQVLQTIGDGVGKIVGGLLKAVGILGKGLLEAIGEADFSTAFDLVNTLAVGGIGLAISKFLKSLSEPLKGLSGIMDGVTGILDGVRGSLEAFQTQLKAGTLIKIATAVALLAASIFVISLINSDKLAASLASITVLFADLMGAMAVFGKIGGNVAGVTKTTVVMIGMSIAILMLSAALVKIGSIPIDQMITGVLGVAGLTSILVTATKSLSKSSDTILKGTLQIVILAAAIKILASACADLSKLSWEDLGKGLLGVGALLLQLSIFLNITKFDGKTITTAVGITILAAAIKILASACKDFGSMDWTEIEKGLTAIGVLLLEISVFTKLTGNAKHVISTGVALIAISAGIKILASAMKDISEINSDELIKSLLGMGAALLTISIATKLMPKDMIVTGVALIAVSTALVILAQAMKSMGEMSGDELGNSLTALGVAIGILAVGLKVMSGTLKGSAALLIAVAALTLLVPVLSLLGAMSWDAIVRGLTALGGAFAVIGIAGALLTPVVPAILSLAGAFALVGLGMLGIGAGLLAAGAGLSALAVGFSALAVAGTAGAAAVAGALTVIVGSIASMIPMIIMKLGEGIVAFITIIGESAGAIGEAFTTILLTLIDVFVECVPALADGLLKMVVGVLEALVEYVPQISDLFYDFIIGILESLAKKLPDLITAAIDVLMAFFSGIVEALNGIDVDVLLKGIAGVGLLSALMMALAAVALLVPAAMVGVLGLGLVIAELALVLAAVGAFAQIPGLSWLIGEGAELLGKIGNAIGSFIGGIIGGVLDGVTSVLPGMGSDLSEFMVNLQPFIAGAKKIDEQVTNGIKGLAETILILTAANVINGLTSWLTGDASIVDFGKELAEFGPYFSKYYSSIKGIDGSVIVASSNAAKALAEMAKSLPNSGGVAGWFAGENSLSKFADELAVFGPSIKKYADSVKGLDGSVVVNSANAAKALSELAANLPNSGGLVSWFTGDNDIATFGEKLVSFGNSFKSYYESVSTINTFQLSNIVSEFKKIVDLASGIENIDTTALGSFGSSLTILGQTGVDGFINAFTNSSERVSTAGSNMMTSLINGVSAKKAELIALFDTIFGSILLNINLKQSLYYTAGQMLMSKLISGTKSKEIEIKMTYTNIITDCLNIIKNKYTDFYNVGSEIIVKFISGAKSKIEDSKQSFVDIANSGLSGINSLYSDFYNSGVRLVDGFANGISDNTWKAEAKSRAMARAASNAAKKELDEHSPSKVGYGIGDFFGIAFVNGIADNIRNAKNVGTNIANSAKDGLSKGALSLKNIFEGEFNTQPVIKPVLDLTDFKSGVSEMWNYMGYLNSDILANTGSRVSSVISRPSTIQQIDSTSNTEELKSLIKAASQNGGSGIVNHFNITGNNPKEIAEEVSRIIQRQVERKDAQWG